MIKTPKSWKYNKIQRLPLSTTKACKQNSVKFGKYGIQSDGTKWVSAEQIEICRQVLRREINRKAPIWIRVFPHKPIFSKDIGQRMGKGKGERIGWVCAVRPGHILFEIGPQVSPALLQTILRALKFRLGLPLRLVESMNPIASKY